MLKDAEPELTKDIGCPFSSLRVYASSCHSTISTEETRNLSWMPQSVHEDVQLVPRVGDVVEDSLPFIVSEIL